MFLVNATAASWNVWDMLCIGLRISRLFLAFILIFTLCPFWCLYFWHLFFFFALIKNKKNETIRCYSRHPPFICCHACSWHHKEQNLKPLLSLHLIVGEAQFWASFLIFIPQLVALLLVVYSELWKHTFNTRTWFWKCCDVQYHT